MSSAVAPADAVTVHVDELRQRAKARRTAVGHRTGSHCAAERAKADALEAVATSIGRVHQQMRILGPVLSRAARLIYAESHACPDWRCPHAECRERRQIADAIGRALALQES